MKNNVTELVFILDRSGSMQGLESDTIGGFNSLIEKQKREDGTCYVSTVLFDTESRVLHDRVELSEIKPMTGRDYFVGGCTGLVDAVCGAIRHIGNIHKYARTEDVPEHTMFVIVTDGMENASRRYTAQEMRKKIERQQKKYGWEFIFLGANIDAIQTAENYGIHPGCTVDYVHDGEGTRVAYDGMNEAITRMRKQQSVSDGAWKCAVEADYAERNHN